jgi:hypothetical protein
MTNHLVSISHRQITGRWMDRAFLLVLGVFLVLGVSSVTLAVNAARTPVVRAVTW